MGKKKILIADDEKDFIELLKTRLEKNGYDVISEDDGTRLVELIAKERPDLLMLDIKMGATDGYTVVKGLKKDERTKYIPIIILTAHEKMRDLFEIEGISDYIVKPFDAKDLLARITKILG